MNNNYTFKKKRKEKKIIIKPKEEFCLFNPFSKLNTDISNQI